MMQFNPLDLVRLHNGIKGMTPSLMRDILQSSIDNSMHLSDLFTLDIGQMMTLYPQMKQNVAAQLTNANFQDAEKILEQLESKGFQLITLFDEQYPEQYKHHIHSMPPLLYVHGNTDILQKSGIGFGGARNVSREGLHATDQLAQYVVKEFDYTVISGHAKGVDMIAHQSAIAAGGETILVLPEGALRFRLNEALRAYWAEAKDRIVIMTQFAPKEPWHVRNAMSRNGTAICLAKAFCVIESGDEKGGTWEAGNTALTKNIPLYVLDYDTPPESAKGNKKLIAKGGIPIPYGSDLALPAMDMPSSSPVQTKLF